MLDALGFSSLFIYVGGAVRSFEDYIVVQIAIHPSSYRFVNHINFTGHSLVFTCLS